MIIIDEHLKLLLNKYNLNNLYNKYLFFIIVSIINGELFYWCLLYFNNLISTNKSIINNCSLILFFILFINIFTDYYFNKIKSKFLKEIKIANTNYYITNLMKLNKNSQLNFDLTNFYSIIHHLNDNLGEYIINLRIKYDIPFRFITLCIIKYNKKYYIILILFIIYYLIINKYYKNKLIEDIKLDKDIFNYDNNIRNYIINSKSLLINNQFNLDYISNKILNLENTNEIVSNNNNNVEFRSDIILFIYTFILIINKLQNISQDDFFIYFLLVFDVQYVTNKIMQYYKGQININKMKERIDFLNNFLKIENMNQFNNLNLINYNNITIKKINNKLPKLISNKELIINLGEHYLIDGVSGSGKTSFLYLFKNIIKSDILEISPSIDLISNNSFLILPNHKDIFDGLLYDIITNYSNNYNQDLINKALEISNFIYQKNINIIVEKLSSGEKIRLNIARTIYTIIINNYKILLFDEIDENLNDELGYQICKKLLECFHDKTILYITHNNKVKTLFKNKFFIKEGIINQ